MKLSGTDATVWLKESLGQAGKTLPASQFQRNAMARYPTGNPSLTPNQCR